HEVDHVDARGEIAQQRGRRLLAGDDLPEPDARGKLAPGVGRDPDLVAALGQPFRQPKHYALDASVILRGQPEGMVDQDAHRDQAKGAGSPERCASHAVASMAAIVPPRVPTPGKDSEVATKSPSIPEREPTPGPAR